MIKNFEPRLYQQTILGTAIEKNTLVVLPTGMGKTHVFLMLAAQRLKKYPESKILFLGPTRPLIAQYKNVFLEHFNIDKRKLAMFTGYVSPEKREKLWKESQIIFSTPQGLENDIISNRISLEEVSLLGFDEAHRAVGDYSYVWIARQYTKYSKFPRVIGLTASPGSDMEKIKLVCKNLYIDEVEVRTENDPDVRPYVQEIDINWLYVELPKKFKEIHKYLSNCQDSKVSQIKDLNLEVKTNIQTKRDMLGLRKDVLKELSQGKKDYDLMKTLSLLAEAMKVQHALELLETQGISPLIEYMEGIIDQSKSTKVKAVKNLVKDLNFKSALVLTRKLKEIKIEHPKLEEVKDILRKQIEKEDQKIIVFSQYRDSISTLVKEINKIPKVRAKMFVGQAKKKGTGLTQKEQIELIEKFKENEFNVLVMSSVGEEGLDIPQVDLVVFYEPIPSAIRTIQRRGRTGRQSKGNVIVLVAKGTRDEGYRWASYHKEKRMYKNLKKLRNSFNVKKRIPEKKLTEFILPEKEITIFADHREKRSGIVKKLLNLGIKIKLKQLEIGDYLLSSDLCVEYKTVEDFVGSLLDKRLFTQLKEMKKYPKQLVVIEGEEDVYAQRKLHPNAIRGMLGAICIDYGVPILQTKNVEETALLLATLAKREQDDNKKEFTLHSSKPLTLKEQQEYLISALPGVGPVLSKPLLRHFKSVKNIINASEDKLREVELIGEKKAARIKDIVEKQYT